VKVAYYAANMQGLTWVKPVHDITGGTLCTDRETTFEAARAAWPEAEIKLFAAGAKWSARRSRGVAGQSGKASLSKREDHVSLAQIARELKPDVVVTTANFPHYIRRSGWRAWRQGGALPEVKQAQIFHGISSKHNKFKPFMANYDLLLFVGERDRQRFQQIGVLDKTRWKLIGLPRSDRLARGEIKREETLVSLQLPNQKTFLYAPTHSALSSFFDWGLEICQAVPSDCNLIIKPHPLIARAVGSGSASDAMWKQVLEYSKERANTIFLAEQADIQQLMVVADVLVTDFSSAAEEFLLLDRPLVFANHLSSSGYHLARGEWDEIHSCGEVVTQADDLPRALLEALHLPEKHQAARQKMRDFVFHKFDGLAAQRAAQALRELVGETPVV
jgi:hypothetical protein